MLKLSLSCRSLEIDASGNKINVDLEDVSSYDIDIQSTLLLECMDEEDVIEWLEARGYSVKEED